jgi:hypothetical protein
MTSARYDLEYREHDKAGYSLVHVSGYEEHGQARYAAIWRKTTTAPVSARHGMTFDQYDREYREHQIRGYRLVHVAGYTVAGIAYYAAIWEKRPGPPIFARHGLSDSEFQQTFEERGRQGYRLVRVSGYAVGGRPRFAAIWEKRSGPAWVAHHRLDSSQFQERFNAYAGDGYRLSDVSGYRVQGQKYYAGLWEKKSGRDWVVQQGMDSSRYQEVFNDLHEKGFRISVVSAY